MGTLPGCGGHTEGVGGPGCRPLAGEGGRKGSHAPLGTAAAARGLVQGRCSHRGPPGRPAEGRGRAVLSFLSPGVGGPAGHAQPSLCPAPPQMSPCPSALTGVPSRAACRHQAVPHVAGPLQSLDAGPLGRWTALSSAAPGNGRVPKTAHATAAFTFRPMLRIAWLGPLLEVKSCLLLGGLLLLWLAAVMLPEVGLVGRSVSLMWTEGCAGQGLEWRLLLPHTLPARTKDGPTLGLAPRRGAGQALTRHHILVAVEASLLFAKVTRGLRKTPGGPYPPGPSRTMSLWGCPRGPPSYASSFGEGAGLPVHPGEAGCPQGAAGLPPILGLQAEPSRAPWCPPTWAAQKALQGQWPASWPPRGNVSPSPSSAGCQGDSPGLELRDARGPV